MRALPPFDPPFNAGDLVKFEQNVVEIHQDSPDDGALGFIIRRYAVAFWEIKWFDGSLTAEYTRNIKLIKERV